MRVTLFTAVCSYTLQRRFLQFRLPHTQLAFTQLVTVTGLAMRWGRCAGGHKYRSLDGGFFTKEAGVSLLTQAHLKQFRLCYDQRLYATKGVVALRRRTQLALGKRGLLAQPNVTPRRAPFVVNFGAWGAQTGQYLHF